MHTEHFPRLRLPVLFVQGRAAPLARPRNCASICIAAPMRIIAIEGAGYELSAKVLICPSRHYATYPMAAEGAAPLSLRVLYQARE